MSLGAVLGASWWQTVLAVGGLVAIVAVLVVAQVWSQRRRRRGEEAATAHGEGAEAMLRPFPPS